MYNTNNMREFIRRNDQELRYLVTNICSRHEVRQVNDIIQDVYVRFCSGRVFESYDSSRASISTFLFPIISNIVRSHKKSNESKIENNQYYTGIGDSEDYSSEIDIAFRCNNIATEYQNVFDCNGISEGFDSLESDLRDFEENYLAHRNKKYKLSKRRNKSVITNGCSLLEVFRHLKTGLTNREISQIYGVSDMFVTSMKKDIKKALKRYGIAWDIPKKTEKTRKRAKKTAQHK